MEGKSCVDNGFGYFAGTGDRRKRVVPYYFPRFGSNNYKSFLKRFSFLGKRKRSAVDQDTGNAGIIYVTIISTRGYIRLRNVHVYIQIYELLMRTFCFDIDLFK